MARLTPLIVAVALLPSACATSGLSFVTDERVEITSPRQNETLSLPFELTWSADGFDGVFVVFFDRSPMRPNETLLELVPKSDPCRFRSDCPDALWLAERNIYVTSATRLTVERLPDLRDNDREKDRHDVTIVLLDADSERSGESAFTKEFIVDRGDQ